MKFKQRTRTGHENGLHLRHPGPIGETGAGGRKTRILFGRRDSRRAVALGISIGLACCARVPAQDADYVSDRKAGISPRHSQQWGELGFDTAAAAAGRAGSPMRIGDQTFAKGLGHHANGEIAIVVDGAYSAFHCLTGVQWQGGGRGSVVFRVAVDGVVRFESDPMSDSDPARRVEVSLEGARELRLIADDAGDGIGCDMANWAEARLVRDPRAPRFGAGKMTLAGQVAPPPSAEAGGFALIAGPSGPQIAVMAMAGRLTASVERGEEVRLAIPVANLPGPVRILADLSLVSGGPAEVELSLGKTRASRVLRGTETGTLATGSAQAEAGNEIVWTVRGADGAACVRLTRLRYATGKDERPVPCEFPAPVETIPPPVLPGLRPPIEQELIEWDWRMQDGIGTPREGRSWEEAVGTLFQRGDQLVRNLSDSGVSLGHLGASWEEARKQWRALPATVAAGEGDWESLWRRVHRLRRQIAFRNPLAQVGPLLFVKHVPSAFSHQLTQYAGRCARPGGGLFVLDAPGTSMRRRQLGVLPPGSYLAPDVSWDGRRVLFSFCQTDPGAVDWRTNESQFYRLYEIGADGSGQRQLTHEAFDDFAPRYLPDGKILFLSTRRGGFHRCGRGPCPVHAMAVANADGSEVRLISFHETHEWDPAVLNDGRIVYTRWDYVDRHAVYYQQLWTARPDGSDVRSFYGNNTLNPVGVWEARPVPGSTRVMATAGAHHAMTAGSVILLDVALGTDGLAPIRRLTPDALFPESESPVQRWRATAGVPQTPETPSEERRWPGHCYRTPYPLSEDYFLAAYSYDPLLGEPLANPPNMFGLYLVDRFGNKELIYRDPGIGSLWPMPLRARPRPPALSSSLAEVPSGEGAFYMQDVYDSWPDLGEARPAVKRLRILQVLPKTTPHSNTPRVGLANASPGKQVLGTAPVEEDGSAFFRAPAGIPLAFQALDEHGMAIQTMRSLTYLQPGERIGCVGCHERRDASPAVGQATLAGRREPSLIAPGPDGSKPFSYPILVQPVLDRHCVSCHRPEKAEGGIDLTGAPTDGFSASYHALAPRVAFSEWKGTPQANFEPLTHPDRFGARASPLTQLLREGHEGVALSEADWERLATWMDANALFYGTFDPDGQRRQQRGERIAGPALE